VNTALWTSLLVWAAFEIGLLGRDAVRGKGGTAQDRSTRWLIAAAWITGYLLARTVAAQVGPGSSLLIGHWSRPAGLSVFWLGLALRVWAVVTLGAAFRTTVEVDAGQRVVQRGPYRVVRHPSYTGMTLISAGVGLALGNWLSLAIIVLLPLIATLRRIAVEEATLRQVLGEDYVAYSQRTKRLIPFVW
jgi:protein-S-isoprenylcysteine O-methyltransferase Ste14